MTRLLHIIVFLVAIESSNGGNLINSYRFAAAAGGTIGPISVASDPDDGQINEGSFFSAGESSDGEGWIGNDSTSTGVSVWGFFRFILPSGISSGATITSAILTLRGRATFAWTNGVHDLRVSATDSGNASAPTTAGQRPTSSGGSTTITTEVNWDNVTWSTSGNNTSPNIASIIQELVTDNGGLASSAGIVIWVRGNQGDNVIQVSAELNEFASSSAVATLAIVWTP